MKKENKKLRWIIAIASFLVVALILMVLDYFLLVRDKKTGKNTENTPSQDASLTETEGIDSPSDNEVTPSTDGADAISDTPSTSTPTNVVNPDSSTSIEVPATTDYSNVTGSQFDERN